MNIEEFKEFAGWAAAGLMGSVMGVRKLMTLWAKDRATSNAADVTTERAKAEVDVISLLRTQLDVFVKDSTQRMQDQAQMRKLIDDQAHELRELHSLVTRLRSQVDTLGSLLVKNGITPPPI